MVEFVQLFDTIDASIIVPHCTTTHYYHYREVNTTCSTVPLEQRIEIIAIRIIQATLYCYCSCNDYSNTIIHATIPHIIQLALAIFSITVRSLSTAEEEATNQFTKYKQIAEALNAQFIPFAIERTGRMGKNAIQFIRKLTLFTHSHETTLSKRSAIERSMREIVIVIECGNRRVNSAHDNSYYVRIG